MTLLEEYNYKMRGKGVGLLEFFFWGICPYIAISNIYNIFCYATGRADFHALGFFYSLILSGIAVLAVAVAIFLNGITFWVDITLVAVVMIRRIIIFVSELLALLGVRAELPIITSWLSATYATFSVMILVGSLVALVIQVIFLVYIIEHKDVYGYSK